MRMLIVFLAVWLALGLVVVLVAFVANWRAGRLQDVPVSDYWILPLLVLIWPVVVRELWRSFMLGSRGIF